MKVEEENKQGEMESRGRLGVPSGDGGSRGSRKRGDKFIASQLLPLAVSICSQ